MKNVLFACCFLILVYACKSSKSIIKAKDATSDFTLAFGSCNKTSLENELWDDILAAHPDVWIWGGDIIYADTENMAQIRHMYEAQNRVDGYRRVKEKIPVIGTWDDHDYGLNDGGVEFVSKVGSQHAFLDFMNVPEASPRRTQEGVYAAHDYVLAQGSIKVIVLDTRYFRTALTPDTVTQKRNRPNTYGEGTLLGDTQWIWLENQLTSSKANFNVIVSSIQVLSAEHGFETWGNFPHETDRLLHLIASSKAQGVVVLSGDRHISEFSKKRIPNLGYPLVDFTSSGLTHTYTSYSGEPNPYRIGNVVTEKSFGLVKFNFKTNQVRFKMIGNHGEVLGSYQENY
ncbi:alkaline phosphatase D family protein [Arenibacter sp. GZD96]|uniref:alkaline phosphatase D family protein n=1 Tax=Aurantibrevibacter litoralis TaxID=3106030 RepID=UPI002AFE25FE|nr:alkaline phosphatase D family protein [Arenibacter sp. GZD-96]MEA1785086.1 alkaline phosphatase D family protein [Arenibacter sp. GZD-96]